MKTQRLEIVMSPETDTSPLENVLAAMSEMMPDEIELFDVLRVEMHSQRARAIVDFLLHGNPSWPTELSMPEIAAPEAEHEPVHAIETKPEEWEPIDGGHPKCSECGEEIIGRRKEATLCLRCMNKEYTRRWKENKKRKQNGRDPEKLGCADCGKSVKLNSQGICLSCSTNRVVNKALAEDRRIVSGL